MIFEHEINMNILEISLSLNYTDLQLFVW